MAEKLSLEIRIKTIAEREGIQLTESDVKTLTESIKETELSAESLTEKIREVGKTSKDVAPVAQSADAMAKAFSAANNKGAEFGNTIAKLTDEQLLALEEKLRDDIKATAALGQNTDDLKRKLTETYNLRTSGLEESLGKVSKGGKEVAETTGKMSQQFNSLKTAGAGANNVMAGLAQGGIAGLNTAVRGLITTVTALGGSAIGAVLLPALALVGAGFVAMGKIVSANEATVKKWRDQSTKNAADVKASLAEIEAAGAKALKAQIEDVEKLNEGYGRLTSAIEKSRQRVEALNKAEGDRKLSEINAREAEALGKAPDEASRTAITKKFASDRALVSNQAAGISIENKSLNAELVGKTANEEIAQRRAILEAAENAAIAAKEAAANSLEALRAIPISGGGDSAGVGEIIASRVNSMAVKIITAGAVRPAVLGDEPLTDDARVPALNQAKAAAAAAAEAQKNLDVLRKMNAPLIDAANERLKDAELTKQIAEKEKQTLDNVARVTAAAKRVADAEEKKAQIAEQVSKGISPQVAANRLTKNSGGLIEKDGQQIAVAGAVTPAVKAVADAITAAKAPEPIVLDPIATGFTQYHQENVNAHTRSGEAIAAMQRQLSDQASALKIVNQKLRSSSESSQQ